MLVSQNIIMWWETKKEPKTLSVNYDTWDKLWELKRKYKFKNLDQVIYTSACVLEILMILAEKYKVDPLDLIKDMVDKYDYYSSGKIIIRKGGL